MVLEAHLTYRCTLACQNCNRACNLNQTHTPDLTLLQFENAIEQIPHIERIVLIGGEPTLHPHLLDFGKLALQVTPRVLVYSNAFTQAARDALVKLEALGIKNSGGTEKLDGPRRHPTNPLIAPVDFGIQERQPCAWWGRNSCGYSLDACGFSPCSIGGAIDGILRLGVRTWNWWDIDQTWRIQTLCRHCGAFLNDWPEGYEKELVEVRGQLVSRTWANALARDSSPPSAPGAAPARLG